MRQDVIARQVAAMKDAGLDAVVSISPENFAYITGFLSPTQPLMRWRHAMVLVTADGRTSLVSVDMEQSTIRAKAPPGTEIAVWREFQFDAMRVLADLLHKHNLDASRIGTEMDYLPAGDFTALVELLPRAGFVPAQRLLSRLREIKTPAEIDILRRLAGSLSLGQIASELYLSPNTVKTHTTSLYRKLGARSRTEAVKIGRERLLI